MLELIIHTMEACVVLLIMTMFYRVHGLTNRFYAQQNNNNADELDVLELTLLEREVLSENVSGDKVSQDEGMIFKLFQSPAALSDAYEKKINILQQAQLFASTQLVDVKRQFNNLESDSLDWLREACAFYLIGACDEICRSENCEPEYRDDITLLALKSSLNISKNEAYQYLYKAHRGHTDEDVMNTIKNGSEAVQAWLTSKAVPSRLELPNQLEQWGVFA